MIQLKMKLLRLLLILFITASFASDSYAGWLLTGKNIDPEGKVVPVRIYIEKHNIKVEQPEYIAQFNMKTRRIILVDPVKLTYYHGSIDEYMEGVKTFKKEALKEATTDMPVEQTNAYNKTYSDQIDRFFDIPKVAPGSVAVKKTDVVFKMVGWQTEKYEISLNGLLKEEVWIAPGMKAGEGFDWPSYFIFLKAAGLEDMSLIYMNTPEYLDLMQIGFPLRKMVIVSGARVEFQVNRLEEKIIPEYEFYTPSLCKELKIEEWLKQQIAKEGDYDDYE